MAFDFEALVGHLYVVSGRSLSAQPPGMLVEVAPKKAARGRELDTIFVMVSPSGDATAPAAFYDQMANLAVERYFNSSGSVTSGLRTIFNSLNEDLTEHNSSGKRHYEANLLCAVLKENELFLARAGSSVAIYQHNGESFFFPTEFTNEDLIFGPPLGVQPVPDIKMTRHPVNEGSRLLMGDSRLVDLDSAKTTAALYAADISDVLGAIKNLVTNQIMLTGVEFVSPEFPSPESVKDTRTSSRQGTASVTTTSENPDSAKSVNASPQDPVQPRRSGSLLGAKIKLFLSKIALFLAGLLGGLNRLLDRILPPPQEGKKNWFRTSTAAAIATLIPILIVGVVVVLGVGLAGESEFEVCVEQANKTAQVARSISSSDRNGVLAAWNATISKVSECNQLRAGDPSLAALIREGQDVIDRLTQVERRQAQLVKALPNAELTRVVLQGLDLYVLDAQNQRVYRVTLDSDGRSAPGSPQPIAAMRFGAVIGEYRVDRLVDITWSQDSTQIVALDQSGLLIECSPRFLQDCRWQKLPASERWVNPIKMTLWQGRLYLLDPRANQGWRYDSTGGSFASSPIEYFSGEARPNITTATGFGIDDKGVVYILTVDGQITKWISGASTPFTFANFPPGQQLTNADSFSLNTDPIGQGILITNRLIRTIYETTLAGTWVASYQVFNEDDFAGLTVAVSDANQQVIYALSGNSIFVLEKQRPQTQ